MKFLTKSNLWTINEDKVLEAGVKKYGLHNWFKVCTLFRRKTSEQCRLRWKNFVNPSINKEEFGTDEDSKILNAYKRFPNQWATISKLLKNRSPYQCKERFEKIINNSLGIITPKSNQNNEHEIIHSKPLDLCKKLKHSNNKEEYEEDFDEYDIQDQEMIEETKARLANSLGRKSIRKLRQLEMKKLKEDIFDKMRIELEIAGIPLFHLEKEILKMSRLTQKYKKDY